MQARRLAKRSSMGSRRLSAGPAAALADGVRPPKPESAWRPPRREGSAAALEEEDEDEDVVVEVEEEEEEEEGGLGSPPPALTGHGKGPLRGSLKVRPGRARAGAGRRQEPPGPARCRRRGPGGGAALARQGGPGRPVPRAGPGEWWGRPASAGGAGSGLAAGRPPGVAGVLRGGGVRSADGPALNKSQRQRVPSNGPREGGGGGGPARGLRSSGGGRCGQLRGSKGACVASRRCLK